MQNNNIKSDINVISLPIYKLNNDESIQPNPLFHRSNDKLHSRCIEYPFAASKINETDCILDIGSTKANDAWNEWLDNLPNTVYLSDFDNSNIKFKHAKFYQADVRKLPFKDNSFDKIIAVSVIEHIGLSKPQVNNNVLPIVDKNGDWNAVKELGRLLKNQGELIMTLPFGIKDGLILNDEARCYNNQNITKFNNLLEPVLLEYYEYQYMNYLRYFEEDEKYHSHSKNILTRIKNMFTPDPQLIYPEIRTEKIQFGSVTWRRVPIENAKALNSVHTDGIICGVWRKKMQKNKLQEDSDNIN